MRKAAKVDTSEPASVCQFCFTESPPHPTDPSKCALCHRQTRNQQKQPKSEIKVEAEPLHVKVVKKEVEEDGPKKKKRKHKEANAGLIIPAKQVAKPPLPMKNDKDKLKMLLGQAKARSMNGGESKLQGFLKLL